MRVLHIITGLNVGGAEMMLYKLLSTSDKSQFTPAVISLTDIGAIGKRIKKLGIPVHELRMKRGIPSPVALLKLIRLLKESEADVIQSWMYHADLMAGIAAKFAGGIPVVWGIRHSDLSLSKNKRSTIFTATMCAKLSRRLPAKILCCSYASQQVHVELGYCKEKMVVVPNGFDVERFKSLPGAKSQLKKSLSIDSSALLIGLVGRFDPQKDHLNFINAAGIISKRNNNVHFVLCGADIDVQNKKLMAWISKAGVNGRTHLLGLRDDISKLMAGFDVYSSSSSFGEGFPNVIGEAMSCAIPCVVTDVGDSALIVGDAGLVIPPHNSSALAAGLQEMIDIGMEQRQLIGLKAKDRIIEKFSLPKVVLQYENLYLSLGS